MITANYYLYADWSRTGLYNHANSNLSSYILNLAWEYGIDTDPERSKFGTIRATLDNSTSIFSSYNPASPLNTPAVLVLPGVPIKITMDIGAGEVTQFVGFLQSVIPTPGLPNTVSTAELIAYGPLSQMSDADVHLALQSNKTAGYLLDMVLDGVDATIARDIDVTTLSTIGLYWVTRPRNALQLAYELQDAECGTLRENKLGEIAFESRAHRAAHSVVATFGATGGPLYPWNLRQEDPLKGIWNFIEAEVHTFNRSEDSVLATISDVRNGLGGTPPVVPANGSITVPIPFPTPTSPSGYLAVDTWGTVDIEINTAPDGSLIDITNEATVVLARTEYADRIEVKVTSTYGDIGYIILLRVHGTAVIEGDPVPVSTSDAASITAYKKRTYPNSSKWLTDIGEAQDYCAHIIAISHHPRPQITFQVKANYDAAHLAKAQSLDVSDRVHIHASVPIYTLGLDGDFFVEYIRHHVDSGCVHIVEYTCKWAVAHTWAASGVPYTPKVIPSPASKKVPDDLCVVAISSGLKMTFGVFAWKWNAGIYQGEFRAKFYPTGTIFKSVDLRTPAEGGTLVHNGTTQYVVTGLGATPYGFQYVLDSPAQGVWYYAMRLENVDGWSVWSDGNDTPQYVKDSAETEDPSFADTGPPADWTIAVKEGPLPNTVVVYASRPRTNGKKIIALAIQIKDATTGSWRAIDADAGAADTIYDGSAIDHIYNKVDMTLTKAAGNYGAAAAGDLILFDVRDSSAGGWSWDPKCCQWAMLSAGQISGLTISNLYGFRPAFAPTGDDYLGIRIKIVKAPCAWNTEGYLGDEPNRGLWGRTWWNEGEKGNTTTQTFCTEPIVIPSGLTVSDIQARAWFENIYSRSDDDIYSAFGSAGQRSIPIILIADEALVDAGLGRVFAINSDTDYTILNPIGNPYGGQVLVFQLSGAGVPTLDTGFRLMDGMTIDKSTGRDYLGAIYNADTAEWDAFWQKGAVLSSVSLSPSATVSPSASISATSSASTSRSLSGSESSSASSS